MGESSTGSRSGEHEGDAVEVLVHELGRQEVTDMLLVSCFFLSQTHQAMGVSFFHLEGE
jgi:hypothetical protein